MARITAKLSRDAGKVTWVLSLVAFLLVLASVAEQVAKFVYQYRLPKGYANLLNLDSEMNVPTFFSGLLLLFAAFLIGFIARTSFVEKSPYSIKWAILSFGFLFMAFDETLRLHERLISPVRRMFGDDVKLGVFYYAWVVPGIILVAVLGIYFLRFLFSLPAKTKWFFIIAAGLYLGGALGLELVGGWYAESAGAKNLTYSMIVSVEEALEMMGVIVFIRALLLYMNFDGQKPGRLESAVV